jgi:Rad3-related DNA helicase
MFTDMRQGTGRLIRSATDKGIIAILDVRVWTGSIKDHDKRLRRIKADPQHKRLGYGKELLDILGFTTLTNDFTRLGRWYKKTFTALNTVNTVKEREDYNGETKGK